MITASGVAYPILQVLGALLSVMIIWVLTGVLVYEAILRVINPPLFVNGRLTVKIARYASNVCELQA
jgi:Co/Zn/Cd efflux system component